MTNQHNYWLKKKDATWKNVTAKWVDGHTIIEVELKCGRKYRCQATDCDGMYPEPVLRTECLSYDDPRFYHQGEPIMYKGVPCGNPISNEPWDEKLHELRYGIVEKIAMSVLFKTGELSRDLYKDSLDYYEQFDTGRFYTLE